MHATLELLPVSEHEWLVADDDTLIGVVEEHSGEFDVIMGAVPWWHPHFDNLEEAAEYFSEYASAMHLGVG